MSTTLSRRIRRIGLLPTTFKVSTEKRLVKSELNGEEKEKTFTKKIPIRHQEVLSKEVRSERVSVIRAAYKVKNAAFRARRKQAKADQRIGKTVKPAATVITKGKKAA